VIFRRPCTRADRPSPGRGPSGRQAGKPSPCARSRTVRPQAADRPRLTREHRRLFFLSIWRSEKASTRGKWKDCTPLIILIRDRNMVLAEKTPNSGHPSLTGRSSPTLQRSVGGWHAGYRSPRADGAQQVFFNQARNSSQRGIDSGPGGTTRKSETLTIMLEALSHRITSLPGTFYNVVPKFK
jgi:hypothetical protein